MNICVGETSKVSNIIFVRIAIIAILAVKKKINTISVFVLSKLFKDKYCLQLISTLVLIFVTVVLQTQQSSSF